MGEGAAGEREALNEEKVDFLTAQLKETEVRADAAERMNAVLNNTMAETKAEIEGWTAKIQEMEDLMVSMDNLADDPNYDVSKIIGAAKAAARPASATSAKDMWAAKSPAAPPAAAPAPAAPEPASESRSSSRASRQTTRTPKDPTPEPEPEPESEEEEEEEEEEAPAPAPPAPEPEPEEEEESEEESEEEESDEE